MSAICVSSTLFGDFRELQPEEQDSTGLRKRGKERNQAHSGQSSGNASIAVSTDTHTSTVASQEFPADDRVQR